MSEWQLYPSDDAKTIANAIDDLTDAVRDLIEEVRKKPTYDFGEAVRSFRRTLGENE